VIAAIHRRRVLPLAKRRLSLWEMTSEADWEGSRMSPDPLPFDALQWRVSGTIIRGTLKTPNSQLVTPISIKLQRPDGSD
jgi:hypothetical protein